MCFSNKTNHFTGKIRDSNRREFIPVSTFFLRKSVRFFIIIIFLIIKTLSKLNFGQYAVWMTRKPRKGDSKELKSKTFPWGTCPRNTLETYASGAHFGSRSIFIPDAAPEQAIADRLRWGKLMSNFLSQLHHFSL